MPMIEVPYDVGDKVRLKLNRAVGTVLAVLKEARVVSLYVQWVVTDTGRDASLVQRLWWNSDELEPVSTCMVADTATARPKCTVEYQAPTFKVGQTVFVKSLKQQAEVMGYSQWRDHPPRYRLRFADERVTREMKYIFCLPDEIERLQGDDPEPEEITGEPQEVGHGC